MSNIIHIENEMKWNEMWVILYILKMKWNEMKWNVSNIIHIENEMKWNVSNIIHIENEMKWNANTTSLNKTIHQTKHHSPVAAHSIVPSHPTENVKNWTKLEK